MQENLENLKNELEKMKTYLGKELFMIYNRNTEAYEILILKRDEKIYQQSSNIVYQNLSGISVKFIHKNRRTFIKPSCYCFKNTNAIFEENKSYTLEELKELEIMCNQNNLRRR